MVETVSSAISVRPSTRSEQRLFAAWLATAAVMLWGRWRIVGDAPGNAILFPLAACEDLVLAGVLAWFSVRAVRAAQDGRLRTAIAFTGWSLCLLLAIYAAFSTMFVHIVRAPLTVQLINLSDHLRGIHASLEVSAAPSQVIKLAATPIVVVAASVMFSRLAPAVLAHVTRTCTGWAALGLLAAYAAAGAWWLDHSLIYRPLVENPEWALVRSLLFPPRPVFGSKFPAVFADDFLPPARRSARHGATGVACAAPHPPASVGIASQPPLNVVMVILESVGARRLELYGASVDDTPNLLRIAKHAAVFDRIYVAQASTSCAMATLFCSVYPLQDFSGITRLDPAIRLPSIGQVLKAHGYRTGFIHDGQIYYDREGEFLAAHGFDMVAGSPRDYPAPRDSTLAARLMSWIGEDRSRPFFAALWTQDAHHPYCASGNRAFDRSSPRLNRYINAIDEDDALIGTIADELERAGLADNTVLVVTGDHGEAFFEHGQAFHDESVFDEEMRVPLMIVNRRLFPAEIRDHWIGQQVEIAPTILDLLGYPAPVDWQGASLFSDKRLGRAYLFANAGAFVWGLVEGDTKYILDGNYGAMAFNLAADPLERHNLADDPGYAARLETAKERLAAWFTYQNRFLEERIAESPSPARQEIAGANSPR